MNILRIKYVLIIPHKIKNFFCSSAIICLLYVKSCILLLSYKDFWGWNQKMSRELLMVVLFSLLLLITCYLHHVPIYKWLFVLVCNYKNKLFYRLHIVLLHSSTRTTIHFTEHYHKLFTNQLTLYYTICFLKAMLITLL